MDIAFLAITVLFVSMLFSALFVLIGIAAVRSNQTSRRH
uniref:Uncharacterized protein n=1 Tax=Leviviridae sp. TaxID=2027243 RepID=A0A514DAY9_9VIRU|nr:MAG: hypothetical protein H1Rhizo26FD1160_000002 [Leviviridae sp.]